MRRGRVKKNIFFAAVIAAAIIGSRLQPVNWKLKTAENELLTEESIRAEKSRYYGFFADSYMDEKEEGLSRASVGVLAEYLDLWKPGKEWYNGVKLNSGVLDANIEKAYEIAAARDEAASKAAYEDEFNDPNYSMLSGLGSYEGEFIKKSGVGTDSTKWNLDTTAELYNIVDLVRLLRSSNASVSEAKAYYAYPRPYRWNVQTGEIVNSFADAGGGIQYDYTEEQVVAEIAEKKGLITKNPSNDGGFPSGHTNAAFLAAFALAYAVPEQYDTLMMRAAELGNNRIVAGMHSPLDVMGGRMTATAIAASALYHAVNAEAAQKAYSTAREKLVTELAPEIASASDYEAYQEGLEQYIAYLTYGFGQIGDSTEEMRVPKGAEALLRTRFPYLSDEQIRWVLYSTGLESGYPLLDDEEGWGRLNLYAASNGYGAFYTDVRVIMDASKGGFHKADNWMNDIEGAGSLTKQGTGMLTLAGHNSYTGGTEVKEGTLVAASGTALGCGDVTVSGGVLTENVAGEVKVEGDYEQSKAAKLVLHIGSEADIFIVEGAAKVDGVLMLEFENGYVPSAAADVFKAEVISGKFDEVIINGLSGTYDAEYESGKLVIRNTADDSSRLNHSGQETVSNTEKQYLYLF